MNLALADIDGGWTTRVSLGDCRELDEQLCRVARVSTGISLDGSLQRLQQRR